MILCYTCNHYDVCFLTATRMVGALGVQFCEKEREMSHKTVEIIRIFAQFLRMARKKKNYVTYTTIIIRKSESSFYLSTLISWFLLFRFTLRLAFRIHDGHFCFSRI